MPDLVEKRRQNICNRALAQAGDPQGLVAKFFLQHPWPEWLKTEQVGKLGTWGATSCHGYDYPPLPALDDRKYQKYAAKRHGWDLLKEVFEKAWGFNDAEWAKEGEITHPSMGNKITITKLQGVQIPHFRVPQGTSRPSGIAWCGLFATWVWVKEGLPVKWDRKPVKKADGADLTGAGRDFALGDICFSSANDLNHHFIPVARDGAEVLTVEGNVGQQGKPKPPYEDQNILVMIRSVKDVSGYYRAPL